MSTHDIHDESTSEQRDERHCGHHDEHRAHGRRGFGPGMREHRGFGPGMREHRGFGPGPFGPGFAPRPDGEHGLQRPDDHGSSRRGEHRGHGRQRRLDRRILRTARIVAFAEHRAGREAVERTMAASVSHADHEATMRTLRTIARAVRAEHLPERGHGHHRGERPQG